jgi:hypothetical protein
MGSKGMKHRRQSGQRQHLQKVGGHADAVHEQQLEREAIFDTMGLGRPGRVTRWIVGTVVVLMVVAAVITLIALD